MERRACRLLVVVALLIGLGSARAAELTDDDVRRAIQVLSANIKAGQNPDGSWTYAGYPVGITALMVLALRQGGGDERDAAIRDGVDFILSQPPATTYGEGLVLCALEPWGNRGAVRARLQKSLDFLLAIQGEHGGWTYKTVGGYDFSNTQFAVLGLGAAQRLGMRVPERARRLVTSLWLKSQNSDGGWGYIGNLRSQLSMTCAGVASLSLLGVELEQPGARCGTYVYNRALQRGLRYISRQIGRAGNINQGRWPYYTWYALERVAVFLDLKTIGGVDWYREGAEKMVGMANKAGATADHAFALLFLAKAATPLAIAKWRWNGDWNNDHRDVRNWLRHSGKTFGQPLDWVAAKLDRLDSPAAKACLIYASGHTEFKLTPQEIEFLRAYLKAGGMVVAEPCCNRKTFARSFAKEMQARLYPGRTGRLVKLPDTHPLYYAQHRLSPKQIGIYQLRFGGCQRKRVFLLDRDIGCALNQEPGTEKRQATARKIADNLLAYAMKDRELSGKLDRKELEREEPPMVVLTAPELSLRNEGEIAQFRCPFGRLKHRGDWEADEHFFGSIKRVLSDQKAVPDFDGEVAVDPATAALFSVPVLFANGHDDPKLRPDEIANLRTYLQNGGVMVASSCCSTPEFDRGFRAMVAQTLPNDTLEEIPADDAFWKHPFNLRENPPQGNDRLVATYPKRWGPILGVRRDGRWVVLYSPVDFCCAFEGDLEPDVVGYDLHAASRLLTNMLAEVMRIQ